MQSGLCNFKFFSKAVQRCTIILAVKQQSAYMVCCPGRQSYIQLTPSGTAVATSAAYLKHGVFPWQAELQLTPTETAVSTAAAYLKHGVFPWQAELQLTPPGNSCWSLWLAGSMAPTQLMGSLE